MNLTPNVQHVVRHKRLLKDTFAVGLLGHQQIDEGYLPAGTLVKLVTTRFVADGPITYFMASTDGGKTWFSQKTYQHLEAA